MPKFNPEFLSSPLCECAGASGRRPMVHRAEQLLIGVRELLKGKLACFDADDDEGGSPSILEELIAEEFEALELEI
eukprot:5642842-Pleurochrysis_carterae.AAC.1